MLGVRLAELGDDAPQVGAQFGDRNIVANIDAGQSFRQRGLIQRSQGPLREIVRKTLGQEMVLAERLKGVIENGGVARLIEARHQFSNGHGLLVFDADQIRGGDELKWLRQRRSREFPFQFFEELVDLVDRRQAVAGVRAASIGRPAR